MKVAFPEDFPERLERFKEASGLSWGSIARFLGISPYRLRQWRLKGIVPGSARLFYLLTLAESIGLRDGILMILQHDLPNGTTSEIGRRLRV